MTSDLIQWLSIFVQETLLKLETTFLQKTWPDTWLEWLSFWLGLVLNDPTLETSQSVCLINLQSVLNILVQSVASSHLLNVWNERGWNGSTFFDNERKLEAFARWSVSITWWLYCWLTNVISLWREKKKKWRRGWIIEFNRGEFAHCSGNSLVRLIITTSLSCLEPSSSLFCFFVSVNKAFCFYAHFDGLNL